MTDQSSPITPPFELINQWHKEACKDPYNGGAFIESQVLKYITTAAAQWGSDQELEACIEWQKYHLLSGTQLNKQLRAARRLKPPSLKEQAIAELEKVDMLWDTAEFSPTTLDSLDTIRRALEVLPND